MVGVIAAALAAWTAPAWAQLSNNSVKIGVATDLSSLYADINGPGAVIAVEMAIADFGGSVLGKKIELVSGDIQNKADVAASLAARWYDNEKVDMILGAGASSSSIAIQGVAGEKKRVYIAPDPASSDLTGKLCNPYSVHWVYDTAALANGTGSAVVKSGGKEWFFLTADYAFGYALQRDVAAVVTKAGGKVVGEVRHPLNTADFSSFLLQAQASKAQIIGLANAGGDTINSIKQAAEFGIVKGGQKLAGLLVFISDVHSLGLRARAGPAAHQAYYWDLNDKTRAFVQALRREVQGAMPTMVQAGFYSATLALPQRGQGRRHRRSRQGDGADEGHDLGRSDVRQELDPRRRPQDARHVSVRGQGAGRVQGAVGLLQAARHDPGRRGFPSDGPGRLPDGRQEELSGGAPWLMHPTSTPASPATSASPTTPARPGVFQRAAKGGDWKHVLDGVEAYTVFVHPGNPEIVFAGTNDGVWRSTDRGATFKRTDFPDKKQVWSFMVDSRDPKKMLAGASPIDVYRSEDGGESWRKLATPGLASIARDRSPRA